jgi:hypothetical protein
MRFAGPGSRVTTSSAGTGIRASCSAAVRAPAPGPASGLGVVKSETMNELESTDVRPGLEKVNHACHPSCVVVIASAVNAASPATAALVDPATVATETLDIAVAVIVAVLVIRWPYWSITSTDGCCVRATPDTAPPGCVTTRSAVATAWQWAR